MYTHLHKAASTLVAEMMRFFVALGWCLSDRTSTQDLSNLSLNNRGHYMNTIECVDSIMIPSSTSEAAGTCSWSPTGLSVARSKHPNCNVPFVHL